MKTKQSGIYEIRNIVNNHRYIGSSVDIDKRWKLHINNLKNDKHHSRYLQNAWNLYGENNFSFNILFLCDSDNVVYLEDLFIKEFNPEYNICKTAFSSLGIKRTDEFKRKISETSTGRKMSEKNKKELSERMKGNKFALGKKHVFTDEHIQNLTFALRGRKLPPVTIETREKLSISTKNVWAKRKQMINERGVL